MRRDDLRWSQLLEKSMKFQVEENKIPVALKIIIYLADDRKFIKTETLRVDARI